VTSSTYRQSSRVTPELLQRDPGNELLARGPRFRVDAETIRDVALSASGLLTDKIGGPSVRPPQPAGVSELAYGSPKWELSKDEDRYRRGLYTYLKRATPYPGLVVFDAPTANNVCTRRNRSNTPLQALTLLNDTVFVEASQALAKRILTQGSNDERERIRSLFRLCLSRNPDLEETAKLTAFLNAQRERFKSAQVEVLKIASEDFSKGPDGMDGNELAAWVALSRAVLNLDETVTKE